MGVEAVKYGKQDRKKLCNSATVSKISNNTWVVRNRRSSKSRDPNGQQA